MASVASNASTSSMKENSTKTTEREMRKTGLHLNLDNLVAHFGKRLEDTAQELGVGRWPCNEKQKTNPSLFETEGANTMLLDRPFHKNVPQRVAESTQHLTVEAEHEKVVVKARYEDDNVKFELCLPSGMDKILEEVGMRLNLKKGSFKLKYKDEDNDVIFLACDVDLQLYLKSMTAAAKTYLQLWVQLIRK